MEDRREDRLFEHKLLDFGQNCLAQGVVQLDRLLLVERVDIGVAAIRIGATFDYEGFKSSRYISYRGEATLDDVLEFLF